MRAPTSRLLPCLGVGLLAVLVFVLAGGSAAAEELSTAADVTEPGRSLERAVRVALGSTDKAKRTVVFLLDPTPSVKSAGFETVLMRALAPALEAQPALAVGLAVAGDKKGWRLAPARDAGKILEVVQGALVEAKPNFRNLYGDARRLGSMLAKRSGKRELVIVSLDNGDAEDDVESTAAALARLKVRTSCITSEVYVADSYYLSSTRTVPRGVTLGCGDAPYVTLPWGWLFQSVIANETTPSGYAYYGLTHLAAATKGRVFLYSPPGGTHRCAYLGSCPVCPEDHQPTDDAFQTHRLKLLAPPAATRSKAGAVMARDPWFRAMLKAWGQASKAGLLRSKPSIKIAGGGVKPERRVQGRLAPLMGSISGWKRLADKSDKTRTACEKIIASLRTQMESIGDEQGQPRYRAMCDFTLAMLHVTKANLVAYSAFCRDVAPALLGREPYVFEPPEVSPVVEGRRVSGISCQPLALCHGVAPLRGLRLPGGAAWQAELDALDKVVTGFMRRYGHTPYAMALRHQGIARFTFIYRGTGTTVPPPNPKSRTENETTETGRPNRAGGSTSGGGSGSPTTGGG